MNIPPVSFGKQIQQVRFGLFKSEPKPANLIAKRVSELAPQIIQNGSLSDLYYLTGIASNMYHTGRGAMNYWLTRTSG